MSVHRVCEHYIAFHFPHFGTIYKLTIQSRHIIKIKSKSHCETENIFAVLPVIEKKTLSKIQNVDNVKVSK